MNLPFTNGDSTGIREDLVLQPIASSEVVTAHLGHLLKRRLTLQLIIRETIALQYGTNWMHSIINCGPKHAQSIDNGLKNWQSTVERACQRATGRE